MKQQHGIEAIRFHDDNFNVNVSAMTTICEELINRNLDIKWVCEIRVDNIKRTDLELMSAAGCVGVEFGAESGSQRILNEIVKKKVTLSQIIDVDRWCSELGIFSDALFIVSHPTETFEEAQETADLISSLRGKATLGIMKIYPGTEIEDTAYEMGLLPHDFSWSTHRGKSDYIPSVTGEVPLFLDKLTMQQITELMSVAWIGVRGFSFVALGCKILSRIKNPRELLSLVKLGIAFFLSRLKLNRF